MKKGASAELGNEFLVNPCFGPNSYDQKTLDSTTILWRAVPPQKTVSFTLGSSLCDRNLQQKTQQQQKRSPITFVICFCFGVFPIPIANCQLSRVNRHLPIVNRRLSGFHRTRYRQSFTDCQVTAAAHPRFHRSHARAIVNCQSFERRTCIAHFAHVRIGKSQRV